MIGQGITKTTKLEHFVRHFQVDHPGCSGMLGCAHLNIFGKKEHIRKKKESFYESNVSSPRVVWEEDNEDTTAATDETKSLLDKSSGGDESEEVDDSSGYCCESTIISRFIAQLSKFRNDLERRDLISIGVATGFAAAFGAPVGGLLYSIEEMCSYISVALMWRTLAATAVGTLVISLYYGDLAKYSVLSLGVDITTDDKALPNRFAEIPFYALIGAACGILGAFFNGTYVCVVQFAWCANFIHPGTWGS